MSLLNDYMDVFEQSEMRSSSPPRGARGNSNDGSPTRGNSNDRSPTRTEVRSPTSTSTSTEVRSPTSTSTDAYTRGNVTVTGGAGAGAHTTVHVFQGPRPEYAERAGRSAGLTQERIVRDSARALMAPRPRGIPIPLQEGATTQQVGLSSLLNDYMTVFEQSEERSSAPTTDRTSEWDLNVPFPVLPGALSGVKAPTPLVRATSTVRRSSALAPTSRYSAARPPVLAPMLLTTPRAAKAAGGPLPPPSPAMGASLPPPPDAPAAPMPPPPDAPASSPLPDMPSLVTNANRVSSVGTSAPSACPKCECATGSSRGILLLLLAAGGAYWIANIKKSRKA